MIIKKINFDFEIKERFCKIPQKMNVNIKMTILINEDGNFVSYIDGVELAYLSQLCFVDLNYLDDIRDEIKSTGEKIIQSQLNNQIC